MRSSSASKRLENSGSKLYHTGQRAGNWLQLHDHGLEAVRMLLDSQVGNPKLQILLVLEETGLLRFLKEAWVWQDQEVCQEFVQNWDFKSRTTRVHGTKLDLSLNHVLSVSGFRSQCSTEVPDRSKMTSSSTATRCARIFPVQGAPISSCKDDLVRDLLELLSKTLWFPCIRQPSRAPRELINLVLEALDGAELNWAKCVYIKFLAEMKRLQILRGSFCDEIRTLAGPFMYFLYTQTKRNPEALSEIVQYHNKGAVTRVQRPHRAVILDIEESKRFSKPATASVKSDNPLGQEPAESTLQAATDPPKPPCPPTRPNKKRRPVCGSSDLSQIVTVPSDQPFPSSPELESMAAGEELLESTKRVDHEELANEIALKNEQILELHLAEIDSRLYAEKMEMFYLEEQKHVQECMKLHFEAVEDEDELADLKAKVSALQLENRELEKKERFLEVQLADMRRRWETATIRAELAEIQAAEKSSLLLRLLPRPGKEV